MVLESDALRVLQRGAIHSKVTAVQPVNAGSMDVHEGCLENWRVHAHVTPTFLPRARHRSTSLPAKLHEG